MQKLVVVSDLQIGYQDDKTLDAVDKFLIDFQPDTFVMNGDIVDMTSLSKFRLTTAERDGLVTQRDTLRRRLWLWRRLMPSANMIYVMGNHEQRLATYIADNAPELAGVLEDDYSFMAFAGGFGLGLGITYVMPYGAGYEWPEAAAHRLLITHGTLVREHTAAANMDTEGGSGITGHTHRISAHYKTDRDGAHAWYEGGCLCRLDGSVPPAKPGIRNWQQGFVVGYASEEQWNVYQVSITGHKFVWNGVLYAP